MRIVIQRVSHASVTIEGHCKSATRGDQADGGYLAGGVPVAGGAGPEGR